MKSFSALLAAVALCGLVGTAAAQQLEVNDVGGTLKAAIGTVTATTVTIPVTADPVVGTPLCYGPSDLVVLRVEGAPSVPLILLLGELATTSTALPSPSAEFFDLDLASFLFVLADGFTGTGGLSVFDDTNPAGVAQYIFPLNASITLDFAFQAVVADAADPFGLNFTAAPAFTFHPPAPPFSTTGTAVIGDDVLGTATLAAPVCMYGTSYTELKVSTNGFICFGSAETSSDLSESVGEFTTGNPGSSTVFQGPMIAAGWDDLDVGNRPSQGVAIEELAPGIVSVRWVDADRFSSTFLGDINCLIDSSSGTTIITLDYDMPCGNFSTWTPLIGVSAGSATATVSAVDLATGGVVNPTAPLGGVTSIYEYLTPTGTFDLEGVTLTFLDGAGCAGDYFVF